jgi:hypothetical protein
MRELAKIEIELELANTDKTTLVNVEELDKIEYVGKKWFLSKRGYVQRTNQGRTIMLHRLIKNCPKQLVVNHKNFNILDNRKENLECILTGENIAKGKIRDRTNMRSKHKGIMILKNYPNKFYARIKVNGNIKSGGCFNNIDDAIEAVKNLYKEFGGNFD